MKSVLVLDRSEVVLLLQVLLTNEDEYDAENACKALDMVVGKLDLGFRPIRTLPFQKTTPRF